MRMLGALVNVQLAQNGTTETVVHDHALDGAFDDELGMAGAAVLGRLGVVATDEAGVAHVFLLRFLLAGEHSFFGVDDNDVIAGVDVIGEDGLVFAAKQYSGFFRHTTDNLVVCVDYKPLAFYLFGLGAKSFHREPGIKPCSAKGVKVFCGFFE